MLFVRNAQKQIDMTNDNKPVDGALDVSDRHQPDQSDNPISGTSPAEPPNPSDSGAPSDFIKDDRRADGPPPIDPTGFFTVDGGSDQQFDEFLRSFDEEPPEAAEDEEFGTLKDSQIVKGSVGLLPPELGAEELESDEIAFGISGGELQTIVRTLSLLMRFQSKEHRRCRITITSDGATWQGNQGNGFIEYFTPGAATNLRSGLTVTLIVALDDLKAVARAAREIATFRIKNEMIRFSSARFRRPIMTFSARSFPAHTDALLSNVDLAVPRPDMATPTVGSALLFLGTIAPRDEDEPSFNVIRIKASIARAMRASIAAQVESSVFDGLDIAFRPHFLRWLLPALKLRSSFQAWHSDKFCVMKNDNLKFGFELVPHELPNVPAKSITDTILTPAAHFLTFVERSVRMLKNDGMLTLTSDQRGNEPLLVRADDEGQTARVISGKLDAYRDGQSVGPIKVSVKAAHMLKGLRITLSHANVELAVAGNAVVFENPQNDAKYSVMVSAKVTL